jgi:hypothetical protein
LTTGVVRFVLFCAILFGSPVSKETDGDELGDGRGLMPGRVMSSGIRGKKSKAILDVKCEINSQVLNRDAEMREDKYKKGMADSTL